MPDLETGAVVDGRYKVMGRLGAGGMAEVFLAEDQQLGRKLALKLLHRRFAEDEGFVERFRREAQAAAGLQHPNVVGVYDRGAYDGTYYIAMEYLPGRTLKRLIAEEAPLEPVRAIDLTLEILKAVRFAHRRGVIHRDLKPHNVIVDDSDHAKVTDFGIARAGASDMTETGSILGTAQYLSPEQAQGHAVSPSSDLYSIGVILYELLTGRLPFDAEAAVTIAIKHVSEAPVAPRTLNPAIPPQLEQVVLWSLNKNPADRPADAQEMIEALSHAKATIVSGAVAQRTEAMAAIPVPARTTAPTNISSPPPYPRVGAEMSPVPVAVTPPTDGHTALQPQTPPPPPERSRRRDLWLWLVLVALVLAAAGAAAYYLLTAPTQVAVPSVVGKQLKVAKPALRRAGFKVALSYHRSQRRSGLVLSESPPGGSQADPGSTVKLTVSRGPGTVTVPQIQGLTLHRAEAAIRRAGLKLGKVQSINDSQYPAGEVSSSSPIAGQPVPPGTKINLFVSAGPAKKAVPNVIGDTESAARAALSAAGFTVQSMTVTSKQSAGTIISQSPQGGTQAAPGSLVTIEVAKAPPPPPPPPTTKVPNVTGDTAAAAKSALRAAGFTVSVSTQTVTNKSQDRAVISQSPAGGSSAKQGSTVTIVVGHYKKPPTHTTPSTSTNPSPPTVP